MRSVVVGLALSTLAACSSSTKTDRVAIDTATYCRRVIDVCKEAVTLEVCERALSPLRVSPECATRIANASCAEIADSAPLEALCFPPCSSPGSQSCNDDGSTLDGGGREVVGRRSGGGRGPRALVVARRASRERRRRKLSDGTPSPPREARFAEGDIREAHGRKRAKRAKAVRGSEASHEKRGL